MDGKVRSTKYLAHIRKQPCLACRQEPDVTNIQAHHLRHVGGKGTATKTGDQWAVPLCVDDHLRCHEYGDEDLYWCLIGVDAKAWALKSFIDWSKDHATDH